MKSLEEIKDALKANNLELGMSLEGWSQPEISRGRLGSDIIRS